MSDALPLERKSEKEGPALSLSLNVVFGVRLDESGELVVAYVRDAARWAMGVMDDGSDAVPKHFILEAETAMVVRCRY